MRYREINDLHKQMLRASAAVAAMPPGSLEQVENLEQLRVLEAGYPISAALSPAPFPAGIDTPEDLERAEQLLASGHA